MWKKTYIMRSMSGNENTTINVKVDFTRQEKDAAKKLAKSQGMTFQGWLAKLIRDALKEATNGKDC